MVSLRAVPLLLSFKNIWFRKEVSVPLDGKKDENGKSLDEEEEEDGDSREEKGELEDGEESIANGPNNCLNSERLKPSAVEFFDKLSILASPENELSLFNRESPTLRDGLENGAPLQRFAKSSMPQMDCKSIGGIEFIIEVMF